MRHEVPCVPTRRDRVRFHDPDTFLNFRKVDFPLDDFAYGDIRINIPVVVRSWI